MCVLWGQRAVPEVAEEDGLFLGLREENGLFLGFGEENAVFVGV